MPNASPVNLDGQTRTAEPIELDNGSFVGATLIDCELVYAGGGMPNLHRATLRGCRWRITGAARNGLLMLEIIRLADNEEADDLLTGARTQVLKHLRPFTH